MPNPYLLLLREPAVHDDLALSDRQRQTLFSVNDKLDGPLLALRNRPPETQADVLSRLIATTETHMAETLDTQQRERLVQIMMQVRGIQAVLQPEVWTA